MGLRSRSPSTIIDIWGRKPQLLAEVRERDLADYVYTDPRNAVAKADVVVLCTPVQAMPDLAVAIAPSLTPGAIVTDVGSVKGCVQNLLGPIFGERFVGSHPMAGSERSGLTAARADLFVDAPCIVTPVGSTNGKSLESIISFWTLLGASVTTMSPSAHDRVVARISHLPHALAYALVCLTASSLPAGSMHLAGGSFRDATRVAASDPSLWTGIFNANREELVAALREMSAELESLAGNLEAKKTDSILDFLMRAGEHCHSHTKSATPKPITEVS